MKSQFAIIGSDSWTFRKVLKIQLLKQKENPKHSQNYSVWLSKDTRKSKHVPKDFLLLPESLENDKKKMISNNIYTQVITDHSPPKRDRKCHFHRTIPRYCVCENDACGVAHHIFSWAHIHPILLEQTWASAFHAWLWSPSTNTAAKKEGPAKLFTRGLFTLISILIGFLWS